MFDRNEILAGGMIVISTAIFIGFILAIVGTQRITNPVYYTTSFKYAGGLEVGATIRFGGFKVGTVDHIDISPVDNTMIQLFLKVKPGVYVNNGSIVTLNSTSALGENYIEISTGNLKSPAITPLTEEEFKELKSQLASAAPDKEKVKGLIEKSNIVSKEATTMSEAFSTLREMAEEIKKTARDMDTAINDVADEETKKKLREIVSNVRDVTRTFKEKAEPTMEDVRLMVKKARELVDKFKEIVSKNEAKVSQMLTEFRDIGKNLNEVIVENRPTVKNILDNFATSSDHIVKMLDHMALMVEENRPELKAAIINLKNSLQGADRALRNLDKMLDRNQDNVFSITSNLAITTEYAGDFMKKVKRQPYKLFWPTKEAPEPHISENRKMAQRDYPNPDYYIDDGNRNKSKYRRTRM